MRTQYEPYAHIHHNERTTRLLSRAVTRSNGEQTVKRGIKNNIKYADAIDDLDLASIAIDTHVICAITTHMNINILEIRFGLIHRIYRERLSGQ